MALSDSHIDRYARHLLLPEIGEAGQERLLAARVLVIGAGGLGSPAALYLAGAGIGTLGIADADTVDISNLQRQILHASSRIGRNKAESARHILADLNPDIKIRTHDLRVDAGTVSGLIAGYDIIADCTDNFETRFLVNDACHFAGKTLVSAAVARFSGQLYTFKTQAGGPCYRCLFGGPPDDGGAVLDCAAQGILGPVAGIMGCLQATEIVKECLGLGASLSDGILVYDALTTRFRRMRARRDPGCPLCGQTPTILGLPDAAAAGPR